MAHPQQAVVMDGARAHVSDGARPLDQAAFGELYRRTARPLWAYLRRMTGDPAMADDLLQEAFTRLLAQPAPPTDDAALRAWLFRVGSNLAIDAFRRAKHEAPSDAVLDADAMASSSTPGRDPILAKEMGRVFARLDVKERALLWLAYVETSSHRDIAGALGLKESSIRVLLFRARKKLAGLWTRRQKERG